MDAWSGDARLPHSARPCRIARRYSGSTPARSSDVPNEPACSRQQQLHAFIADGGQVLVQVNLATCRA
jgi:hypothetical protein